MTGPITRWLHGIYGQLWKFKWLFLTQMGNIVANCDWPDNCCDGRVGIWRHGLFRVLRQGLYHYWSDQRDPKATVVPIVALMFVGQHDLNTV